MDNCIIELSRKARQQSRHVPTAKGQQHWRLQQEWTGVKT